MGHHFVARGVMMMCKTQQEFCPQCRFYIFSRDIYRSCVITKRRLCERGMQSYEITPHTDLTWTGDLKRHPREVRTEVILKQWCVVKGLTTGSLGEWEGKKPCCVSFARFHGINRLSMSVFRLVMGCV